MPPAAQGQCLCRPEDRLKRVLMVRRLHPAVTMQMLLQTFGVYGSVTGCKVFTHKSGRSAGCASLEFSSHQAACAALKGLQGTLLHGKHVMLQWFDQSLSSSTSPVGRGPGQRSELQGGALSEGGSCAAITARQLTAGSSSGGPQRSTAASCPGISPFGMFATAPPGSHPFCNSTAAMAAAAAAAAAVAAQQQQQQLQHPSEQHAAAATAAALLTGQHQLPPLVVQQLQRQVSAPLGAFSQLSPTGAHIPASPLTPGSHGGGWEALMSPVGPCAQQSFPQHSQQQQQQQREAMASSRGGARCEQLAQQQSWGTTSHAPSALAAAAAKLSAAMGTSSAGSAAQDNLGMAASLQQLATMQQQALAYAAWQNHQQAAAALLQHQLSGQLPTSPLLGGHASAQQAQLHLLGARSMPSELGGSLSAELLLQQATANLQSQQQQAAMDASDGGRAVRSSAGASGSLSRQHSTPAVPGQQLARDASGHGFPSVCNSGGGADSISAAVAGGSMDQAAGGLRARSPGSVRRKSTGAASSGADGPGSSSKAHASEAGHHAARKQLHWEDQRQHTGDRRAAAGAGDGAIHNAAGSKGTGGDGSADGGRVSGRSSSHQLMTPLRGYSGSDDTANVAPDVNALATAFAASRQQQQDAAAHAAAAMAAAAAVSSCYLSSPTWLSSQRQGFGAAPDVLASLQGPSLVGTCTSSSQDLQRSPSAAAMQTQQQQQQNLLLAAAAAAAASGSPGSSAGGFSSSLGSLQQQQQQQSPGLRHSQSSRVSDSQLLMGDRGGESGYSTSATLFNSSSLPGPSAVAAALDAMSVAAATAAAHGWQQQQAAQGSAGVPASEAFKHKHKMHLQLPTESSAGTPGKASLSGGAGDGFDQLITTEVLPESPAAQQQQQKHQQPQQQQQQHQPHAAHSPFGQAAAAGGGDGGSAWADWSASMAALLSPAHVSSLAGRKFEELITLQHGLAQEAAAAAAAAAAQSHACVSSSGGSERLLRHPTYKGLEAAGVQGLGGSRKLGSTSSQAAWLLQQSRAEQQQAAGGYLPACSRPGSLLTSAGSDVFAASAPADAGQEGAAGMAMGKTRHNSLCLDSRPGLLTLSHMFQEAAQPGSARPSPRGARAASPSQQQQAQQQLQQHGAAARHALSSDLDSAAAGYGSFTFQPPVLRTLPGSSFAASSSSNLMICQPFQLPDFFSRDGRMSCPSPRGSMSTPGAAAAAAGSAPSGVLECVGSPLHPSGMQHQLSANLDGMRIPEGSFSGGLDAAERAPGSPCAARNLQHSFSMPARFSAPGGSVDAFAAAAAAAAAGISMEGSGASRSQGQQTQDGLEGQQQQQQQQAAAHAPYGEVFKTIWGPNAHPAGPSRG